MQQNQIAIRFRVQINQIRRPALRVRSRPERRARTRRTGQCVVADRPGSRSVPDTPVLVLLQRFGCNVRYNAAWPRNQQYPDGRRSILGIDVHLGTDRVTAYTEHYAYLYCTSLNKVKTKRAIAKLGPATARVRRRALSASAVPNSRPLAIVHVQPRTRHFLMLAGLTAVGTEPYVCTSLVDLVRRGYAKHCNTKFKPTLRSMV
ncbi:hypothetical protein EVAR_81568_1 [Eumeta japonica]|uniref:Uncharacterized protein n=1 Tax=Eumeta variegata TaxID=151549 RepID=A0A4C1V0P8_EUMVA|nr:hypothetical protein EVAR_81568_1 [Eumeta japonica]